MPRILVVDDEEGIREFLADALRPEGYDVDAAATGEEALGFVKERAYDLLVTDLKLGSGIDGMDVLRRVREELPTAECMVLTAHGTVETAVEAMRLGAFDYLQKPISSPSELRLLVGRALERRALLAFKEAAGRDGGAGVELTFGAPAMAPVVAALKKVAVTTTTALLLGESGTGKEVAARALHVWSPRRDGPFVALNCAAIADSLVEAELFGHERGAFTGAVAQRRGRIELAQGGTFFLDEVGELKLETQTKLLRVLQERRFERVGGTRTLETDARFVAATNRDLKAMIAAGRFREDLYYRLAVFPVELPALRNRRIDIVPLAKAMLGPIARELGRPGLQLSADAADLLARAPLPGNVRELRNILERAAILADGATLEMEHLPSELLDALPVPTGEAGAPPTGPGSLEAAELAAIREALRHTGGNRKKAAERLGIGLRTLYEKLKRHTIE